VSESLTYEGVGVDYDVMDPFKRMCQLAGRKTAGNIKRLNGGEFREFEPSRGESAYLVEAGKNYFAHVEEGLGTKNLVADEMAKQTGQCYYHSIAQDAVAAIVNDMITVGAMPLSIAMHLAVGSSAWFEDKKRLEYLVSGWQSACDITGCVWGGGETPTLKDVILPEAAVISGSALGVMPKAHLIKGDIQEGDVIIFADSSGIHANGLTLAREIAKKLPKGYLTEISSGFTYGEALLRPTYIYRALVEECLKAGVRIHYAVNITGHGWRKIMRANTKERFAYVIDEMPYQKPIFIFMQEHGPVSDQVAFANLNMGAGFAIIIPEEDFEKVRLIDQKHSADPSWAPLLKAGHVERSSQKKVVIGPKGFDFLGQTLGVRG
jgi:phosphoribosylformylglycinamidine cyclo-ligase